MHRGVAVQLGHVRRHWWEQNRLGPAWNSAESPPRPKKDFGLFRSPVQMGLRLLDAGVLASPPFPGNRCFSDALLLLHHLGGMWWFRAFDGVC